MIMIMRLIVNLILRIPRVIAKSIRVAGAKKETKILLI